MGTEQSDDALRAIAFGRGYSPEDVRDATAELQRRSELAAAVETTATREFGSSTYDNPGPCEEPEGTSPTSPSNTSRGRRWAREAGVAVIACALGVAGMAAYFGTPGRDGIGENPTGEGRPYITMTSISGEILYEVPETAEPPSRAKADAWLDSAQTAEDLFTNRIEDIDLTSTHHAGNINASTSAWIARSTDGNEYCVIFASPSKGDLSTTWTCALATDFDAQGVSLSFDEGSAYWNGNTVILTTAH